LTNHRQIRRYIGQSKLVKTGLGKFYWTAHPDTLQAILTKGPLSATQIFALDMRTNELQIFNSVTQAEKTLDIHHNYINKHLDRGVFVSQDGNRRYKFTSTMK